MNKPFNPRTKKVTTIGEELRFQREYYCYKNNVSLPLKVDSTDKKRDERESLQNVLDNYMNDRFENNSEYATSYEILYAIENGRSKKKIDPYNPNSYFLRMFCLFKIYGFLDDITILELLKDRYKLEPSFETSKIILDKIEQENSLLNQILKGSNGEIIKINIKLGIIFSSKDTFLKFTTEDKRIKQGKAQYKHLKKIFDSAEIEFKHDYKDEDWESWCSSNYNFVEEREKLKEEMKKLNEIEQKCTSLELGRDTTYIQNFINGDLYNISIDTLLKTLEYFKMKNEKLYNILKLIKDDFSAYSITYSNIIK